MVFRCQTEKEEEHLNLLIPHHTLFSDKLLLFSQVQFPGDDSICCMKMVHVQHFSTLLTLALLVCEKQFSFLDVSHFLVKQQRDLMLDIWNQASTFQLILYSLYLCLFSSPVKYMNMCFSIQTCLILICKKKNNTMDEFYLIYM